MRTVLAIVGLQTLVLLSLGGVVAVLHRRAMWDDFFREVEAHRRVMKVMSHD